MQSKHKIVWLILSWISLALLGGCTTPAKNLLPHGSRTMAEIYRVQTGLGSTNVPNQNQLQGNALATPQKTRTQSALDSRPSMRLGVKSAVGQPSRTFRVLPNPSMSAYIFPHLAQYDNTRVPVPGYTTHFFLYARNHYAMPGEHY